MTVFRHLSWLALPLLAGACGEANAPEQRRGLVVVKGAAAPPPAAPAALAAAPALPAAQPTQPRLLSVEESDRIQTSEMWSEAISPEA